MTEQQETKTLGKRKRKAPTGEERKPKRSKVPRAETKDTKECTGCKQTLPVAVFSSRCWSRDGLEARCKICLNDKQRQRRKKIYEIIEAAKRAQKYHCRCCNRLCCSMGMDFTYKSDAIRYRTRKNKVVDIGLISNVEIVQQELLKGDFLCFECHAKRMHEARAQLKMENKKSAAAIKKIRRKEKAKEWINTKKQEIGCCADCGRLVPELAILQKGFEFDHIDPSTKKQTISYMVNHGASLNALAAELAKCQLLCRLCHREKTKKWEQWLVVKKDQELRAIVDAWRMEEYLKMVLWTMPFTEEEDRSYWGGWLE